MGDPVSSDPHRPDVPPPAPRTGQEGHGARYNRQPRNVKIRGEAAIKEHLVPGAELKALTHDPTRGTSDYGKKQYRADQTYLNPKSKADAKTHRDAVAADGTVTRSDNRRTAEIKAQQRAASEGRGEGAQLNRDLIEPSIKHATATGTDPKVAATRALEQAGNLFASQRLNRNQAPDAKVPSTAEKAAAFSRRAPEPGSAPRAEGTGRVVRSTAGNLAGVALGVAAGDAREKAIEREKATKGFAPPTATDLVLGTLKTGADRLGDLEKWRDQARQVADAKQPGETLSVTWHDFEGSQDARLRANARTVDYVKQPDGTWKAKTPDGGQETASRGVAAAANKFLPGPRDSSDSLKTPGASSFPDGRPVPDLNKVLRGTPDQAKNELAPES